MRKYASRIAGLTAMVLTAGLMLPLQAQAATTYEIEVGQELFEQGVPGFSARVYPGSIKVHTGDTIHFSMGVGLVPGGSYPQEWLAENWGSVDQPWFYLQSDPDDGERALKFNAAVFEPGDCGSADNPCEWNGAEGDLVVPGETENGDMYVTVTAAPGTTMWAVSGPFADHNTGFKVEVVDPTQAKSDQAALDARAAALKAKDFEDAAALHSKMNAKRTSHVNAAGQKVYDVWVGATGGPIELFASYPKRTRIPRGARVQFHFQDEIEPHTATFGGPVAKDVLHNGLLPVCDPDGDSGVGPDNAANLTDESLPPCEDMSQFEIDVDDRLPYETGDGKVRAGDDYENSGLKTPLYPEETTFDSNPWTVKFEKSSTKKGFKFICLLHGGFMGGRVIVN